jgi:hypothetical protein
MNRRDRRSHNLPCAPHSTRSQAKPGERRIRDAHQGVGALRCATLVLGVSLAAFFRAERLLPLLSEQIGEAGDLSGIVVRPKHIPSTKAAGCDRTSCLACPRQR